MHQGPSTQGRALEVAEPDYRALLQAVPGPYLVLRPDAPDFTIVAASDAYLAATTRERSIVGRRLFDVLPAEPAEGVEEMRRSLQRVAQQRVADVMAPQRCDVVRPPGEDGDHGDERFFSQVNSPVIGQGGALEYIIHRLEDVTELVGLRRAWAERLAESSHEVERASRARTDFLSVMSHELRTPLNSIIGFSEVLIDGRFGGLNDRQARYLGNIHRSGRHLLSLINELLDLSKIEAGRLQVVQQPHAVLALVAEAIASLQPQADAKRIGLVIDTPAMAALPAVLVDPLRTRQVVYNLLSNAIRFTPADGRIEVRGAEDGGGTMVRVSITDTGPGIAEADLPRLFRPFTQVAAAGAEMGGTGLGLALARQLIELMGGRVGVESALGIGSTFWIELPRHRPAAPAEPIAPEATTATPLVLIADDDAGARELLDLTLRSAGFRTLLVATGEEALVQARRHALAAIVLDVLLPGLDGWDVLRVLRADPATTATPVLMVSVSGDRRTAFSLGAVEHLIKPIDRRGLVGALARLGVHAGADEAPIELLVIEDDPAHCELVHAALSPRGFNVRFAATGRAGIEAARAGAVDALLVDLRLPDLSGVEVVAALRRDERTRELPILLVTAHDLSPEDHQRLQGDVAAVFAKSELRADDVVAELRRALRRPA